MTPTVESAADRVVDLNGVCKSYGKTHALVDVELAANAGEIIGLIGPNGAGKTTLLRIIAGLTRPTIGGGVLVDQEFSSARRAAPFVGMMLETTPFVEHLSGRANLRLLARIRACISDADVDRAIEGVGLDPRDRRPVRAYSLGMRQRLALAQAIMEAPPILLLDEPTNGLDPQAVQLFRSVLRSVAAAGTVVFMSSHSLSDVEAMCTRVLFINSGKVTELDRGQRDEASSTELMVHLASPLTPQAAQTYALVDVSAGEGVYRRTVHGPVHEAIAEMVREGLPIEAVYPATTSLENSYMAALEMTA